MNSNIPTFSARKPTMANTTSQSRLCPPSTLRKPINFMQRNASAVSTAKKPNELTGLKRPLDSAVLTSQNKFKRTTPLSLSRNNKTVSKVPVSSSINSNNNPVAARLEFNDNFRTPASNRSQPLSELDNAENDNIFETFDLKASNEPKKVQTESKATSPFFDWKVMESETSSYKSKIALLEKQIDDMSFKNSKTRIENEVKETKMKSDLEASRKLCNELRKECDAIRENETKLKSDLERLNHEYLEQTNAFEKQQLEYEKTISEQREELNNAKAAESEIRSVLGKENLILNHRISELENELAKSKAEMEIYNQNLEELKFKNSEIDRLKKELSSANLQVNQLKDELESCKENGKLKEILKDEINHYQQLQEENVHLKNQLDLLKDVRDDNLILNEKLHSFKTDIESLQRMIDQKNADLGELSFNKKRIDEWIKIVGVDAPDIVISQMNELKQSNALLRAENDTLKADLKDKIANESLKDISVNSSELKLKDSKQEIEQLRNLVKKLDRKCKLFGKQKDSYKRLIDSYESEVTINFDDVNRTRISELEAIIDEYKTLIESQDNELKKAHEQRVQLFEKEKELYEVKSELERIKKLNPHVCNVTNMSLDVSTIQTRETNFRVIHLKDNPFTAKVAELNNEYNNLKEENTRLKALVEVLESGDAADMTRQINEGIQHRNEVEKLKKKYETLDKRYNGLKDTFKKISKSFRETCYYLTGYKIDNIASNRYKLTHAYDPHKRSIFFEVNNKQITMLHDDSLTSLQDKIDTYLTEGDSYPAFLASFTLDLFHNSTNLSRSTMWT